MGKEDFGKYGMVLQEIIQHLLGDTETTGLSYSCFTHNTAFASWFFLNIFFLLFQIENHSFENECAVSLNVIW